MHILVRPDLYRLKVQKFKDKDGLVKYLTNQYSETSSVDDHDFHDIPRRSKVIYTYNRSLSGLAVCNNVFTVEAFVDQLVKGEVYRVEDREEGESIELACMVVSG